MKQGYLGVDIGSSYLKIWHEDNKGNLLYKKNIHHRGSPRDVLLEEILNLSPRPISVCFSGNIVDPGIDKWRHDGLLAEIDYLRQRYPHDILLIMGAQNIEVVSVDSKGRIISYQTNPPCASGTGSFLDEQLKRLGLSLSEISKIPIDEGAPLVATRCAVFAKTDLIHLQQEGYDAEAMYNGLCQGMVISGLKSVFGGRLPDGEGILASGGLMANPHIRYFLKKRMPKIGIASEPAFFRAIALSKKARACNNDLEGFVSGMEGLKPMSFEDAGARALTLEKSSFPSHEMKRKIDNFGNEIWHNISSGESFDASLGVDIGSTSTKAVLVDGSNNIRLDIYTDTAGNPIEATRRIFYSIDNLRKRLGLTLNVVACSTTGSGRKLVGEIIGADLIINEITAHAKGALMLDPDVETIFEIGGQDSKFIRLADGRVVDVNMNYVCAAGTGSFVEEQADILDMRLDEIGDEVMNVTPLTNSDRCTVFMGQEINRQLSAAQPKERIMAGVLVAIFKNYINRVVGNRFYNKERIVFQGATARNKGLVAALEQLTGAQVIVSPFCHVLGAYGASILARERITGETSFRGFIIPDVKIKEFHCKGCENNCRITVVNLGARKISWGYMCGREQDSAPKGKTPNPAFGIRNELLDEYQPGQRHLSRPHFRMPALSLYEEYLPFWSEVGKALGFDIEACYPSDDEIKRELNNIGAGDFCYPIKVAMACANITINRFKDDKILIPYPVQEEKDDSIRPRSLYCPFITGMAAFYRDESHAGRVFTPVIDLSKGISRQAKTLEMSFKALGLKRIPRAKIEKAVEKGISELKKYRKRIIEKGRPILDDLDNPSEAQKTIVILGRPYNLYHKILNLGIPELIESLGYKVISMDIMPETVTNKDVVRLYPDMYWCQGQRILKKAIAISNRPNMFPLVISNFSCGPDSFLLTYFEEISRDKPYLILEMDEHGSATGYQTRIEAFLDMVEHYREFSMPAASKIKSPDVPELKIRYKLKDVKDRTRIWIPQIHPYIPQLWAATLKRYGYNAYPTGEETSLECNKGRSYCRGSECLPASVTIGKFLSVAGNGSHSLEDVLIMPRAEGPCRYGQYATLQSKVIDKAGVKNASIFSPTSEDGYDFLTPEMRKEMWKAICVGDSLFKLRCRSIPYITPRDKALAVFDRALEDIRHLMEKGMPWDNYLRSFVKKLRTEVDYSKPRKPIVGIVGEIFVRMNNFSNQHIVDVIELSGGEAWLAPMTEWIHYVDELVARKNGSGSKALSYIKSHYLHKIERDIIALFSPILDDLEEPHIGEVLEKAQRFIPFEFEGEAILTIGRAKVFANQGVSLVANCAPFGCMPGRITSYIFQANPEFLNIPTVNLFFDGTGDLASQVGIYLRSINDTDTRIGEVK